MPVNQSQTGKTILVVDDNPVILKGLSTYLNSNGYDVATAHDGSEVIHYLREQRPDLILMDIFFPPEANEGGMTWDGFQILEWIRNLGKGSDIPFIVISAAPDPLKYGKLSLAAGARAYFSKPIEMKELLEAIRTTLGVSASDKPGPDAGAGLLAA